MPGYCLVEGVTRFSASEPPPGPAKERIGFLDFLRELDGDEPAIPKFWDVEVVGLEEVLFSAGPEAAALALEIRKRLRAAGPHLHGRLASVFVLFRGRLQRGEDLWCDYRGARLPIGRIFGSPRPRTDPEGRKDYSVSFNLSNGD